MALTTAQLSAIKADILADPALAGQPNNPDGNTAIAIVYNAVASPDYWVWRSFVSDREIYETTTADATTWSWTTFIGRSQGERDAWRQMVNMAGGLNPSLANVRSGIADIFSGAGGANQRTHLLTLGRRKASRVEKLLKASGTGSTGDPALMGFEGPIAGDQVEAARNHTP